MGTPATITLTSAQVDSIIAQQGGAPPIQPPVVEPPIQPPIIPPVVPPQGGNVINIALDWSNPGRVTTPMGAEDVIVAAFTTGSKDSADNNLCRVSGAEWNGPPSTRYAIISETAGDFDHPMGQYGVSAGNSINIPFAVGAGQSHGYPALKKNTTYYANIKNMEGQQTCKQAGNCSFFVELSVPGDIR